MDRMVSDFRIDVEDLMSEDGVPEMEYSNTPKNAMNKPNFTSKPLPFLINP